MIRAASRRLSSDEIIEGSNQRTGYRFLGETATFLVIVAMCYIMIVFKI